MTERGAQLAVILVAGLLGACGERPGSTSPTAAPVPISPSVTQLFMTGLPDPLLFDVASSLRAGQSYALGATATFSDGSVGPVNDGMAWASDNPAVAFFRDNTLEARREGKLRITLHLNQGDVATFRDLTVWSSGETIREERAERAECGTPQVCRYPYCPGVGPYWLFPVHESGTIELIDVTNPGWGSPSNYITQLSPKGEYLRSWLLLKNNTSFRTATVPGGFMYVFTMNADLGPCGDVRAVWTHPR